MNIRAVLIGSALAVLLVVVLGPTMVVMLTGRQLLFECDEGLEAECDEARDRERGPFPPVTWTRFEGTDAQCPDYTFGYWWPFSFDPTALRAMPLC